MFTEKDAQLVIDLLGKESVHQVEIALSVTMPSGKRASLAQSLERATTYSECLNVAYEARLDKTLCVIANAKAELFLLEELKKATTFKQCLEIARHSWCSETLKKKTEEEALQLAETVEECLLIDREEALTKARQKLLQELENATTIEACYAVCKHVRRCSRNNSEQMKSVAEEAKEKAEQIILEQLAKVTSVEECFNLYKKIPGELQVFRLPFGVLRQIFLKAMGCATTVEECYKCHRWLPCEEYEFQENMLMRITAMLLSQLETATTFRECFEICEQGRGIDCRGISCRKSVVGPALTKAMEYAATSEEWRLCFSKVDSVNRGNLVEMRNTCIQAIAKILSSEAAAKSND